ncbi:hypothetical protein MJG53_005536 [Ovis ammon polii x Ovis aries]|uniref:Uncharacterized protein n=1 Tax=Ovis ammon polii x Ovis aries TaxID=2918886 RepID=A0ACB9VCP2_9CETA|nr:hypothetical protein MJG53_005536 [Ovis ammon polii x Ovis aries]
MEQWRQCGRWLIDCRVLPPNHRVVWPSAVVFDLAQALRDGVLLCQLLHNLCPGSIDLKDVNFRPQMSQFLCLKNIRTFLKVCHDKFGLRNSELFDPFDLFDVRDFGKVPPAVTAMTPSLALAPPANTPPPPPDCPPDFLRVQMLLEASCSKAAGSAFGPDHCVPLAFALGALGVECGAALSTWTVPVVAAGPGGRQVPFLLWALRHELLFSLGTVVQVPGSTAPLVGCVLESGPRLC